MGRDKNCAMRTSSSKKKGKSKANELEEQWQKECRDKAPELYAQVLEGEVQPKLTFGDWLIAKYDEVNGLYPEHPKKGKQAWKALFKTKAFPTATKPLSYTDADRFMLIAKCEFIRNRDNWPHLPNARTTLYEITKLTPEQFALGKLNSVKWTRKSINNLRKPPRRKPPQKASPPNGSNDGRTPFGPGAQEPLTPCELTLTGPFPLSLGGEASTSALQYFRNQIRHLVKVATETRPDFKLVENTERSNAV
jgi:hypothetical protein